MSKKVLVAYASRAGATAGVAEAIGKRLVEDGAHVDVHRVQDVDDLSPYGAAVIGSPIQAARWLPEALDFVWAHQAELTRIPCATFTVCMTLAMRKPEYQDAVRTWIQPVRELVKPVSEGLFAGVLDLAKVPSLADRLKFRISIAMGVWSEGDHRDWEAIRGWAGGLTALLRNQGLEPLSITTG